MEVKLNVSVELGPQTLALLAGAAIAVEAKQPAKQVEETKPVEKAKPKTESKPGAAAKKADPLVEFDELDDDARLEAIKTEVTKHTKKGKSADIKALLTHFDAGRASELSPDVYNDFYQAIKRYGAGESIEAITGENDLA